MHYSQVGGAVRKLLPLTDVVPGSQTASWKLKPSVARFPLSINLMQNGNLQAAEDIQDRLEQGEIGAFISTQEAPHEPLANVGIKVPG